MFMRPEERGKYSGFRVYWSFNLAIRSDCRFMALEISRLST